jgi:hypothetical protein
MKDKQTASEQGDEAASEQEDKGSVKESNTKGHPPKEADRAPNQEPTALAEGK